MSNGRRQAGGAKEKAEELTGSDDVVDDQHALAGAQGAVLHLEVVGAVLLFVGRGGAGAGQLAALADGDEGGSEAEGERGGEEEAAGVEADDNVGEAPVAAGEGGADLELEGAQEGGVDGGVAEQGHDVDEGDAGDGEAVEAPQGAAQAYLCTGEFGGGGGGGGGLSSRGISRRRGRRRRRRRGGGGGLRGGGGRVVWLVVPRGRGFGGERRGHVGEEKKRRRRGEGEGGQSRRFGC